MVNFLIKAFWSIVQFFSKKKSVVIDSVPIESISQPIPQPPQPVSMTDIQQLVKTNNRNGFIGMCKRIAKEEGLTPELTTNLLATLECEANFNNELIHPNNNAQGKTLSTDFYICQINDFYHIGKSKEFPSIQYVHDHPDEVVRWMCKMFKAGKARLWVCYSKNLYQKYLPNYRNI